MADVQIELPPEPEEESLFSKIFLKVVVTALCALLGFILILLGYFLTLSLDIDVTEFNNDTFAYFFISTALWIVIGLSTPVASLSRFFEVFKGVSFGRVIVFLLVLAAFVLLYWFLITFAVSISMSVFGTE